MTCYRLISREASSEMQLRRSKIELMDAVQEWRSCMGTGDEESPSSKLGDITDLWSHCERDSFRAWKGQGSIKGRGDQLHLHNKCIVLITASFFQGLLMLQDPKP